jgi:hypothetical protein
MNLLPGELPLVVPRERLAVRIRQPEKVGWLVGQLEQ